MLFKRARSGQAGLVAGLALDALAAGRIAAAALADKANWKQAQVKTQSGASSVASALLGRDVAAAQLLLAACAAAGSVGGDTVGGPLPSVSLKPLGISVTKELQTGQGREVQAVLCRALQRLFLERPMVALHVHQQARLLLGLRAPCWGVL